MRNKCRGTQTKLRLYLGYPIYLWIGLEYLVTSLLVTGHQVHADSLDNSHDPRNICRDHQLSLPGILANGKNLHTDLIHSIFIGFTRIAEQISLTHIIYTRIPPSVSENVLKSIFLSFWVCSTQSGKRTDVWSFVL